MKLSDAARSVSPAHRRWRRLLATRTLDPDALRRPVDAPGRNDVIVCGSSRSGTALVSALLHRPPACVSVMEPWDGLRLAPAELFASLRAEIELTGVMTRTRLDTAALDATGEVVWCREGARPQPVEVEPGWTLAVKWPCFWRYLDLLPTTRFVVCLRDPYQTVASYARQPGRLAQGLDYDVAFHRTMNAALAAWTDDVVDRRALLYEYVHRHIVEHLDRPNVHVVRYERWASDPERQLAELGAFVGVDIRPPNATIRPATGTPIDLDDRQADAVRRLCVSAERLGYDL
jgi:hypothetical protein